MNQENNIVSANESRFNAANYSEALTAFTVGWVDPENISKILDFIAPPIPVGRRFEFKRSTNAEAFFSESDDMRAVGAEFKRVSYQGESVNEKTINKGLTVRVDHDEIYGDDWQERYTQTLLQRLLRNELRRAVAALDAIATAESEANWESGNLLISEHTGVFVSERAATCTKEGVKSHYKCADCGQLFEDEDCTVLIKDQSSLVIPKLEHTADKDWTKTDDEHYKRCTVCGEIINKAAHSSTGANVATCKKKAVCDVCGAEYGEYADHSWTAATCTAPKTCSVCGITEGEALGHTESTQWSYDADNHWHGCTAGCGFVYEDSKAAHSFKWVIDKDATETESGYKHEECESCGYKKAAVVIPATATPAQSDKADTKTENSNTQTNKPNNVKSPQTGNESGVYMWVLVLFVSIFSAYSATAVYKKRYKIKK